MPVSRRAFLELSTMTVVASATAGLSRIATAADDQSTGEPSRADVIARLSLDDARYLVGSTFLVRPVSGEPVRFDCVSVKPMPENATSFAVRFLPRSPVSLPQGTYWFEHGFLGKFRLFIVPSGPKTMPRYYTAIVNHLAW